MRTGVILESLNGVSGTLVALATFVFAFFTWCAVRETGHFCRMAVDSPSHQSVVGLTMIGGIIFSKRSAATRR